MLRDRRAGGESPLKHLDAIKVTDEANRKALTPDELKSLSETTETASRRFGMAGYKGLRFTVSQHTQDSGPMR